MIVTESERQKPFKKSYRFSRQTVDLLSLLKDKTNLTETEIIEKALRKFQCEQPDNPLLQFAGIFSEKEAERIHHAIYSHRHNKAIADL